MKPWYTLKQVATNWEIRLVKGPISKSMLVDPLWIKDKDSLFSGYLKNSTNSPVP